MTWIFTLKNGATINSNSLNHPDSLLVGYNQTSVRSEVSKYTTRAGGLEVGKRRENVGSLDISYTTASADDGALQDVNNVYKWCKYVDTITNEDGLFMTLVPKSPKVKSPVGCRGKVVEFSCSFSTLKPYWQGAEITQTETLSGSAVNRFDIVVDGTAEITPLFKLLIPNGVVFNNLTLTNTYTSESFSLLNSPITGNGVTTLDIDCTEGTVLFGGTSLLQNVVPGTGFFELAPFTNSFEVTVDVASGLDIVYSEGVYFG